MKKHKPYEDPHGKSICIYISGPYSRGDKGDNVLNAIRAGVELMDNGITPYIPHLSHFVEGFYPRPYQEWLHHDRVWINRCDAVLRLPGVSSGADWEVDLAISLGTLVFFGSNGSGMRKLLKHFRVSGKEESLWPTIKM
jgi:hypothetical protein